MEYLISALSAAATCVVAIYIFLRKGRTVRINSFLNRYRGLYKNNGVKLSILLPAGICNLPCSCEIKTALNQIGALGHGHPLRQWKTRVEKIGYKKFFNHVLKSGQILDSSNIETFLIELESK